MAQVWTQKQQGWLFRFQQAIDAFCKDTDTLSALCTEFTVDGYASGGANALTDATVQNVIPAADAAIVWYVVGVLINNGAIIPTITGDRPNMETIRP